jgi:hypothetical protein
MNREDIKMNRLDKNTIALAGEFAVLSQLALQGYDTNMTLGHTKSFDIFVSHPKTGIMFKLEVKTKYRSSSKKSTKSKLFGEVVGNWIMDKKHETNKDPALFYCFAIFCEPTNTFQFYIVPSKVVAKYVTEEHQLFLREKRREGKESKDTDIRIFRIGFNKKEYPIVTPLAQSYHNCSAPH